MNAAFDLQVKLRTVYSTLLASAQKLPPDLINLLGCPYFVSPRDIWTQCSVRILVVGQEPRDWGFDTGYSYEWEHPPLWYLNQVIQYPKSIEALMAAYRFHNYEIPYVTSRPYEKVCSSIKNAVEHNGGDIVYTNLFRCALFSMEDDAARSPLKGSPEQLAQILEWQRGCLTTEIELLKPSAVLFLTGPNYDGALENEFDGIQLASVDERRTIKQIARLTHSVLPSRTYRTYHPGFLSRSQKLSWIDELTVALTNGNHKL